MCFSGNRCFENLARQHLRSELLRRVNAVLIGRVTDGAGQIIGPVSKGQGVQHLL
jgi:hypothetical protein